MKKYLIIILLYLSNPAYSQNGQWLPGGIDLHEHGADHFNGNWKLVFQDEFNYVGMPDPTKWLTRDSGADAWAVSTYKKSNVWVDGTYCNIKLTKEDAISTPNNEITDGHYGYTSGDIESVNWSDPSFYQNYYQNGMFEARISMSGAFWAHDNFWVFDDGELDIDECYGGRSKRTISESSWNERQLPPRTECKNLTNASNNIHNFHVYTCIWDKYFVYFYVDHSLRGRISRFNFNPANDDSKGYNDDYALNSYTTLAGYYWQKKCFFPVNGYGWVILHLFLDSWTHDGDWWQRLWHKQDQELASTMQIDWVRVYQRGVCDEDEVITNPVLLPFNYLEDRYITLGTQSTSPWTNIVPYWRENKYEGQAITLLPGFESKPEFESHDGGGWTHTAINARPCPPNKSEYINPPGLNLDIIVPVDTITDTTDTVGYSCDGIDTTYLNYTVDSLIAIGDTSDLNKIYHILDSLSCWGDSMTGYKRPYHPYTPGINTSNANLLVDVFPNPNKGIFTVHFSVAGNYHIRIMDIVGRSVYESNIEGQNTTIVSLVNAPPGSYFVEINCNGAIYRKKISVIK